jgi:hypothetical protein
VERENMDDHCFRHPSPSVDNQENSAVEKKNFCGKKFGVGEKYEEKICAKMWI